MQLSCKTLSHRQLFMSVRFSRPSFTTLIEVGGKEHAHIGKTGWKNAKQNLPAAGLNDEAPAQLQGNAW